MKKARMRTRLLKPGFFHNSILGQLSDAHKLLYAGLWLLADREGRLKDDPTWIRAEIFPYQPFRNVEPMLDQLSTKGLIVRYEGPSSSCAKPVQNRAFAISSEEKISRYNVPLKAIFIPQFLKHQHPHPREAVSVLPEPPIDLTPITLPERKGTTKATPRPHLATDFPVCITVDPVPSDKSSGPKNGPRTSSPPDGGPSQPSAEEPKPKNQTPPDEPDRNLSIITKIAHEAISLLGPESPDLPDTIKGLCAYRGISYNAAVVGKALDSARVQQARVRQHDAH